MTATTHAALFSAPGQPMELCEVELPLPGSGETLVRIVACTLCGSDVHTICGRRPAATPSVLGHEILGRIEAFGAQSPRLDLAGRPLSPGDRVTWTVAASCGNCFYCRRSLPQKCEALFKYGHEPLSRGGHLSGGLARHCLLRPGTGIVRVPDEVSDVVACPANCATATVARVVRAAGKLFGQNVLVQGAGALGLTACAMAHAARASEVICCDIDAERLSRAPRFGATLTIQPDAPDARRVIDEATAGRGVDIAFELSGGPNTMAFGLSSLRVGGVYVVAGHVSPTPSVAVDPEMLVRRMLTVRGVHNYAPRDLLAAVEFLADRGRVYPFGELVTARFPLADVNLACERAQAERGGRVAVIP